VLISTSYKFIFLHIPKTAGSSISIALKKYTDPDPHTLLSRITRHLPIVEPVQKAHFRVHDTAAKVIRKLGRPAYEQFFSFSVVRDPFDHTVSHYEYMKQFRTKRVAEMIRKMEFEEFLEYRMSPKRWYDPIFAKFPGQAYFVADPDGKILVDRIVPFETVNQELAGIAEQLKLPSFELQHLHKTKSKSAKRPYQDYYNPTTEDMVRNYFAKDFKLFGYSDKLS